MAWSSYMPARELLNLYRLTPAQLLRIARQGRARLDAERISIEARTRLEVEELVAECDAAWRLRTGDEDHDEYNELLPHAYEQIYLLLAGGGLLDQPAAIPRR